LQPRGNEVVAVDQWRRVELMLRPGKSLSTVLDVPHRTGRIAGETNLRDRCRIVQQFGGERFDEQSLQSGPGQSAGFEDRWFVLEQRDRSFRDFSGQAPTLADLSADAWALVDWRGVSHECGDGGREAGVAELFEDCQRGGPVPVRIFFLDYGELRDDDLEQIRRAQQFHAAAARAVEQHPFHFTGDSLGADNHQFAGELLNRRERARFNLKAERCRESNGSQHPEFVLVKPSEGIPDRTDQALLQVGLSADKVQHLIGKWIEEQSVDREITTLRVLARVAEPYGVGMAAVGIFVVVAECSDFHLPDSAWAEQGNHAKCGADRQRPSVAEQAANGFRRSVGRHVVIFGNGAPQLIADAPARPVRQIAGGLQPSDHFDGEGPIGIALRKTGGFASMTIVASKLHFRGRRAGCQIGSGRGESNGMSVEWDCVVVGAGAAGLIAAERAAARGLRTLLLEKNRKPGVKILMSGGTRCNLTHDADARGIAAAFGPQGKFLRSSLARLGPRQLIQLFHEEGVPTKVERTGKVFPCSDTAVDVQQALLRRLHRASAVMETGEPLQQVELYRGGFQLRTPTRVLTTRSLVVTTGGLSYPGCGTTGDGYAWARQFGHTVIPTVPALAPLRSPSPWIAGLQGVTLEEVRLRLRIDRSESVAATAGEPATASAGMVFTHFGISGPAPMNVSRYVSYAAPDARVTVECDLFPRTSLESLVERLRDACRAAGKKQLANILGGVTVQRMADAILALGSFDPNRRGAEVSRSELQRLGQLLKCLPIEITETLGYPKAEVTAGGVALDEVDPNTLQSRLQPGLYFAGEILDLDGPIGGYNFQAAFSTGWVAGSQLLANPIPSSLGSGQ